jgi:hypothetical protein
MPDPAATSVVIGLARACLRLTPAGPANELGRPTLIELEAGPFDGRIQDRTVGDYRHFHDGLLRLHQALAGRAMLTSYEGFEVSLIGNGRGAVSVHVQATAGEEMSAKLAYGFEIDQSFLPAIAAEISRLFLLGPEADPPGPEVEPLPAAG